jgi:hypothetical protein
MEMLASLWPVEIGRVWRHIHGADHQALIQVAGHIHALAAANPFRFQRNITTRHIWRWAQHGHFLGHGEIEKCVGCRLHLCDQARVNAMARNDKETNIIDCPPNFLREAPFYCAVSACKSGDIKHGNFKQHGATSWQGEFGEGRHLA